MFYVLMRSTEEVKKKRNFYKRLKEYSITMNVSSTEKKIL